MSNPIIRFFNALGAMLDDFTRAMSGRRSSDALLAETVENIHAGVGQSYESAKSAGGKIEVSFAQLSKLQSAAASAKANVSRAIRNTKGKSGRDLVMEQQKIVRLQKIASHAQNAVNLMQATLNDAKEKQLIVEGVVAMGALDAQVREGIATTNVAMEELYTVVESAYDDQMAAGGFINKPGRKTHEDELAKRAAKARGRAEAAGRVVEQTMGNPFEAELDEDEMETLKAAYESAGVSMPAESAAVEQTASK